MKGRIKMERRDGGRNERGGSVERGGIRRLGQMVAGWNVGEMREEKRDGVPWKKKWNKKEETDLRGIKGSRTHGDTLASTSCTQARSSHSHTWGDQSGTRADGFREAGSRLPLRCQSRLKWRLFAERGSRSRDSLMSSYGEEACRQPWILTGARGIIRIAQPLHERQTVS